MSANTGGGPHPHVLREYAFLSDSRRGALIGPRGDLVFMCAPAFHDDAVFSALVGGRGHFTCCPADPWFVWGGYYEPRSLVFVSRFVTPSGVVETREALSAPGDPHRAVVLRRVRCLEHKTTMRVELDVRAGFGRSSLRNLRFEDGTWHGVTGGLRVRVSGLEEARVDDGILVAEIAVPTSRSRDLVLEISDAALPRELPDASRLWDETENSWRRLALDVGDSAAPRDAELALAVLHGLTSPGGGMVAAATMSLPERAEEGRNYDYRYAWIRDQCYAGIATASLGPNPILEGAVSFVAERLLQDGDRLAPAYTISGGRVPDETVLRGLRGYPGGADKVGNWVNSQFQLDAFGEALQLFAAAARNGGLSSEARSAVEIAADGIAARFDEPEAGIWELDPAWWTHSRLECVAGLRSVAAPGLLLDAGRAAECQSLADRLLAETDRRCLHRDGRWQRAPEDERVDAALLLPPVRGALPHGDPRTVATYRAVLGDLMREGYVYRFRHDNRPLEDGEGAFLLCGFMAALASLGQGDVVRAGRLFERNRAACGSPGLLAEEYDVIERQLRGNLPQAFVHAMLLEASLALGRAVAEAD